MLTSRNRLRLSEIMSTPVSGLMTPMAVERPQKQKAKFRSTIFLKLAGHTEEDIQKQAEVASKLAEAAQSISFTLAKMRKKAKLYGQLVKQRYGALWH